MNTRSFKAQAIALVMVVLVVASIIGVSLFSRMAKDKQASIDEQESAVSIAQVDSVLDLFVGADIELIETKLNDEGGVLSESSVGDISALLEEVGISADSINLDSNWCEDNPEDDSENFVRATVEYSDNNDYVEYQPGSVAALNLQGDAVTLNDPDCDLRVRLRAMESYSVFIVKRVFDDAGDITETTENYCIQPGGGACDLGSVSDIEYTGSIDSVSVWDTDDQAYYFDFDLAEELSDNTAEIRILPIKGTLALNNQLLNEGCIENKQFNSLKITAEANCNSTYRGQQMLLPGSGTLGFSTLFDYGIYDSGLFQP